MKNNNSIRNDDAALDTADEIASLANDITRRKAEMEAELQKVRDAHTAELAPLETRMALLMKKLTAYMRRSGVADRLFAPGTRSGESSKARFGWRDGAPRLATLDNSRTLEDVAADLYARGRTQYVSVPSPKPVLNRQAIMSAGLTAEELAALGMRVTATSRFYCELKDATVTAKVTSK